MDRLISTPWVHRGRRLILGRSIARRQAAGLGLLGLAVLLLLPMLTHPGAATPGAPALRSPTHLATAVAPSASHGDLIVTAANSPFDISGPASGQGNFVQSGNVSVQAGGVLRLNHVLFTLNEFIGDTGSIAQRLSHLYTFTVLGTVILNDSTITSNFAAINPYSKVYLNVSAGGHLLLNRSALLFPGWVSIYGAGSTLNLTNHSTIAANPAHYTTYGENQTILNDTSFAPSISAKAGAHVNLLQSTITGTYADNYSAFGLPGPAAPLIDSTSRGISSLGGGTWTSFGLAQADSENLTRAVLYRSISAAHIIISFSTSVSESSATATLSYGSNYGFGPIQYNSSASSVTAELGPSAINAINDAGFPAFLTAIAGGGASISLGATNLPTTVTVSSIEINVTVALEYNLTFSGAGTVLTAADTSFQLNWNLTPGTPVGPGRLPPTPWGSNKLFLSNGAAGYFANVTITSPLPYAFWNQSAILPDATSSAVFYRWVAVPVQGAAGSPAIGAHTLAFYSVDANQQNNATATAFNVLATANPTLDLYASASDAAWKVGGYGESGADGIARLLLASTYLTQSMLPDGNYLGGYHVAVTIPGVPNGTAWIGASATPFPQGMDPATEDLVGTPVVFPAYSPSLSIASTDVRVNGVSVANDTVAIGQNLTIAVDIRNSGVGPVTSVSSDLEYGQKLPLPPKQLLAPVATGGLATGSDRVVNLTWNVAENVTGLLGTFRATFYSVVTWNGGQGPSGGSVLATVSVTIVPAYIALTFSAPAQPVAHGAEVLATGTVHFAGNQSAVINVTAIGSDGSRFRIGTGNSAPGAFNVFLAVPEAMGPGIYTLDVSASYNSRVVNLTLPSAFTVAGATNNAGPTPFYLLSFLGLPLWLWIAIAAAIVVGVLLLLWLLRSRAKGKLVECGECGELIPEAATVCPKCGAEFESDLVRCSRCGSTIPANSAQCPECSAQLLGSEVSDPERQGYQDFVEKFRVEAKKELGDNYGEGAFWDWWKRQASYVSFNQWKLQQAQGSRAGMAAPPVAAAEPTGPTPPRGGGGAAALEPAAARAPPARAAAPSSPPRTAPAASAAPPAAEGGGAQPPSGGAAMKPCSNCGKEIPPDYLVCPFCGAVTR